MTKVHTIVTTARQALASLEGLDPSTIRVEEVTPPDAGDTWHVTVSYERDGERVLHTIPVDASAC